MKFDRNTIIGLLLMLLLVIGFTYWTAPGEAERARQKAAADSLARVEAAKPAINVASNDTSLTTTVAQLSGDTAATDSALIASRARLEPNLGFFDQVTLGTGEDIVVRNNKLEAIFSTRGGLLKKVTLKDGYKTYWDSTEISLWDEKISSMHLEFQGKDGKNYPTSLFEFEPSATTIDATSCEQDLKMQLRSLSGNAVLELVYHISPDSYEIPCQINISGAGSNFDLASKPVVLRWDATGNTNEKGLSNERSHTSIYFREFNEKRDYLSEGGDDDATVETSLNWVAYKQNYFSCAVISDKGFAPGAQLAVKVPTDSTHTKQFSAAMTIGSDVSQALNHKIRFFFGPNEFKTLKSLQVEEFDRIIDYGWSIIGWVNKHVIRPMFVFFDGFNLNYGIIILIITLIIKLILFPVTWKNFLSSAKMRVLKPDMDAINEKHKDDALGKQQAIMALYRQTGVNPFAGCIPVLLQMPILYAMFRFFPASIEFRGQSFLWADDLGAYDSILNLPFNIPLYGSHVSGFTLLMCISTFFYTRMTMANAATPTQPGMPNMKVMMHIFTVMMLFFFNGFASGLSL
ncbi:MAG: membrane protein insertase YidC, partial [Flavobacteriales bacterium]|nr:membrane protein insertase YidC [Flavobacteriales bacterium]